MPDKTKLTAFVLFVSLILPRAVKAEIGEAAPASPGTPQVFTGALFHPSQQRYQLARLFLFPAALGNQSGTSALLKLQYGVKRGPEYTAVFYPSVNLIDDSQILLAPDANLSQQTEVPTIVFKKNGPEGLVATWYSAQIGEGRKLEVARGWRPPVSLRQKPALTTLEGLYEGSCPFGPDLELLGIYLAPSRRHLEGSWNDVSSWNTLNYVGSTYCRYRGREIRQCGDLEGGGYNAFWGELLLTHRPHSWRCQRVGDHALDCHTQYTSHCRLTRRQRENTELGQTSEPEKNPFPVMAAPPPAGVVSAAKQCADWSGVFRGILDQGEGQLQPYVQMNWLAIPVRKEGRTACGLTGSAALIFGVDPNGRERHGFALPYLEFDPAKVARLVLSNPANDLIFNLTINQEKILGSVFSKRFGWMGTVSAEKGTIPTLPKRYVPLLTGEYVRKEIPLLPLHLEAEVGPAQGQTYDPITGMNITGWLSLKFGADTAVPGEVENAFYDYFVNYLFVRTTHQIFTGRAGPTGLTMKPLGRIFLGLTPQVGPLTQVWVRQPAD